MLAIAAGIGLVLLLTSGLRCAGRPVLRAQHLTEHAADGHLWAEDGPAVGEKWNCDSRAIVAHS